MKTDEFEIPPMSSRWGVRAQLDNYCNIISHAMRASLPRRNDFLVSGTGVREVSAAVAAGVWRSFLVWVSSTFSAEGAEILYENR